MVVTETSVNCEVGNGSTTCTLIGSVVEVLFTVTVKVTSWPGATWFGLAVLVMSRSAPPIGESLPANRDASYV